MKELVLVAVLEDVLGSTVPSLTRLLFCSMLIAASVDFNSIKIDKNFSCLELYAGSSPASSANSQIQLR